MSAASKPTLPADATVKTDIKPFAEVCLSRSKLTSQNEYGKVNMVPQQDAFTFLDMLFAFLAFSGWQETKIARNSQRKNFSSSLAVVLNIYGCHCSSRQKAALLSKTL